MIIVDRATFLTFPAGTIYAKFGDTTGDPSHVYFGEVAIKGDTVAAVDWYEQALTPEFEGATDSGLYHDVLSAMREGGETSPAADYDVQCRDGLFDDEQRFAIWDRDDAAALVARLQRALAEGYPS